MVNGAGLFALYQADKVIVGNLFGLATLAAYSLVLNLALMPLSPITAVIGNLSLTFLSKRQADMAKTKTASTAVTWLILAASSGYAVGIAMFLDTLVSLIYGRHYSPSSEFRTMVAILSFLRFCRTGPTAVLLVSGGTGRLAGANLVAGDPVRNLRCDFPYDGAVCRHRMRGRRERALPRGVYTGRRRSASVLSA